MRWYRADLHIHSVLSPCGDLDMSPVRIIREAKNKKLDIIAVTDHNHTGHVRLMMELGLKEGITIIPGAEINTLEEVHCLAFFENIEKTEEFQLYLDKYLPDFKNIPEKFGHQLVVNRNEEILGQIGKLLINGLNCSINEVEKEVHRLEGVFIPAHIDRGSNSIFTQLGFIPDDLDIDAVEVSYPSKYHSILDKNPELNNKSIITNSDAHFPDNIGNLFTEYYLKNPSFGEWKMALQGLENRKIRLK